MKLPGKIYGKKFNKVVEGLSVNTTALKTAFNLKEYFNITLICFLLNEELATTLMPVW